MCSKTTLLVLSLFFPAPLWAQALPQTEDAKILASNGGVFDRFGISVALSGPLGVVGAYGVDVGGHDSGAVYILDLATGGEVEIQASVRGAEDWFGYSVAIDGDTIVVGAPLNDDLGADSGSGYMFRRNPSTGLWTQHAQLLPVAGALDEHFGYSVAIGGSYIVVGAPRVDASPSLWNTGKAYVFDAVLGLELREVSAPNPAQDDLFGWSVAISGDYFIVGAPLYDGGISDAGTVYVFDTGTGNFLRQLSATNRAAGDHFGTSVAIDGNLAVIGAPRDDAMGFNSGAVYLFDVTTGMQIDKFSARDGAQDDFLGESVSISGDLVLAGAKWNDAIGFDAGSAHLFSIATREELFLHASDGADSDEFGSSVAILGSTVLVSAMLDDDNGNASGSAYRFQVSSNILNTGQAFCFGDGSGSQCSCGAIGASDAGCPNSANANGAKLMGVGDAAISNDSFAMLITDAPLNKPGLLLLGSTLFNGGSGLSVGDGLLCAVGQSLRSQVQLTTGGGTLFSDFQGQPFGATSFGAGIPANYQFWYRDPQSCSGAGFNFTNAWTVAWQP